MREGPHDTNFEQLKLSSRVLQKNVRTLFVAACLFLSPVSSFCGMLRRLTKMFIFEKLKELRIFQKIWFKKVVRTRFIFSRQLKSVCSRRHIDI